jgi:(R,R)-butanediol dehydrogenase / meso-butanediol dehydrogenase / diacetyl reductase
MRFVEVVAPGEIRVSETDDPTAGDEDILVRMRACGICGSDVSYINVGPALFGRETLPLGHEPAGEVIATGRAVGDVSVGARVVINPMVQPTGIIGNGGSEGALADYLLIRNAKRGHSFEVFPDTVPFDVAALNEPLSVARHFVNRGKPEPDSRVVVFGAGPIGLGALLWLKLRGVEHVVMADVLPERLQKAAALGADAVIDPSKEDITARLVALHGSSTNGVGMPKPATDIYYDAAGVQAVIDAAVNSSKYGATLVIAAMHKKPVDIDTNMMLTAEMTITMSLGYPTEIFETTKHLIENWERFAPIISHRVPFSDVSRAVELASTPGAAEKVVVTFDS